MGVLFCLGVVVKKQEETTINETKALPSYRVFAEARQEQSTLLNLLLEEMYFYMLTEVVNNTPFSPLGLPQNVQCAPII